MGHLYHSKPLNYQRVNLIISHDIPITIAMLISFNDRRTKTIHFTSRPPIFKRASSKPSAWQRLFQVNRTGLQLYQHVFLGVFNIRGKGLCSHINWGIWHHSSYNIIPSHAESPSKIAMKLPCSKYL